VLDHVDPLRVGDSVTELDSVPVALVLVVTGPNRGELGAEELSQYGVALQVDAAWFSIEGYKGKHPPADPEHSDSVPERIVLGCRWKASTDPADFVPGHDGRIYRRLIGDAPSQGLNDRLPD
jgi:hypothetical protein